MYALGHPDKDKWFKAWAGSRGRAHPADANLKAEFLKAVETHTLALVANARNETAILNEERDAKIWTPLVHKALETIKNQRSFIRLPFLKPLFAAAPKTKKFRDLRKKIAAIKAEVNKSERAAQAKRAWAKKEMAAAFAETL